MVAPQPVNPGFKASAMAGPCHQCVKPEQESHTDSGGAHPAAPEEQRHRRQHDGGAIPLTEITALPGDEPDDVQEHRCGDQHALLHIDLSFWCCCSLFC